jgi:large subunit ribosomal protein L1
MASAHYVGGYKMAEIDEKFKSALEELKNSKERKFNQTVELIVNLQKFDLKKNQVNTIVTVPHKIKDKKIAGFLESKNDKIDTITQDEFKKYSDKKHIKNLVKKYDFFIAQSSLMPKVAATFGRALGPAGKMPSPQLGIILNADEKTIEELKHKINTSVKIRTKEASIKLPVGKQDMKTEDILENITTIYNAIFNTLPRDKENIKNVEIKLTMSKPIKINVR